MSNIVNDSFEDAGPNIGLALDWASAFVNSEEVFADFDRNPSDFDTLSQESFERGWTPPLDQLLVAPFAGFTLDLTQALYDVPFAPRTSESFEYQWRTTDANRVALLWVGPATQPFSQRVIPPGSQVAADFDATSVNDTAEAFESNWPIGPSSILAFDITTLTPALFVGTAAADTFEGWNSPPAGLLTFDGLSLTLDTEVAAFGAGNAPASPGTDFILFANVEAFEVLFPLLRVTNVDIGTGFMTLEASPAFGAAGEFVEFLQDVGSTPDPLDLSPVLYIALLQSPTQIRVAPLPAGIVIDFTTPGTGELYMQTNARKYWTRTTITP